MKNLALKTTTSCGLRTKIGEKSNQFLPDFIDASARLTTITGRKTVLGRIWRKNDEKCGKEVR